MITKERELNPQPRAAVPHETRIADIRVIPTSRDIGIQKQSG
jgi:hypothetical protein